MPERIEKLRTLLDELEQELHDVDSLDDESRTMLKDAAEEIQAALQEENAANLEHQTISQKLGETVSEFESSHPTLHAVVGRIVDVLGQMGI
ncbi:MAG TPA: DUF4404 family protein [Pirellulales bacterium]|nr:DUF4404 family protein [Pirellulales bacterium]